MTNLKNKRIVLGVTGGIAAYKTATIASRLVQAGAAVDVVMTESATKFITPLTFQALTHRRVYTDLFDIPPDDNIPHIDLSHNIDLLLIAPATANTIAKMAHGQADNLLTSIALATSKPVLIAPAMETDMWEHPATKQNVQSLTDWGVMMVEPAAGRLASGRIGYGRMAEPDEIVDVARWVLARHGDMRGLRVVVTAGGTREPLDPVRYLTNRSSGRMGHALAEVARDRGATVTLISAAKLPVPHGVSPVAVDTAAQMTDAVLAAIPAADALVMAAAVADYRPATVAARKIKKTDGDLQLPLARTDDILRRVAAFRAETGFPKVVVGFAAETDDLLENARAKLTRKRLDWIVANDVTRADAGFAVETNRVTLLGADGTVESLPLMAKTDVAAEIWNRVTAACGDTRK